jgi:hypothetical protein
MEFNKTNNYTVSGTSNGSVVIENGRVYFYPLKQDIDITIDDSLVTRNRRKGTIRKTIWYAFCLFWIAFLMYLVIQTYESYVF